MAHLISFTSSKFEAATEPSNPINPIAGHALLTWLREELLLLGWKISAPDAEDWGWYISATKGDAKYLVGASGEMDGEALPTDWIVQIDKHRTLLEKLTGKNKLSGDERLTRDIEAIVRKGANPSKIEVDKSA